MKVLLTVATVAQQTSDMKPRLEKNLTGIAGYLSLANASQQKSATRSAVPMVRLEMVAGEPHGNITPPQETPNNRRVRPVVQRKIPMSVSNVSVPAFRPSAGV